MKPNLTLVIVVIEGDSNESFSERENNESFNERDDRESFKESAPHTESFNFTLLQGVMLKLKSSLESSPRK